VYIITIKKVTNGDLICLSIFALFFSSSISSSVVATTTAANNDRWCSSCGCSRWWLRRRLHLYLHRLRSITTIFPN